MNKYIKKLIESFFDDIEDIDNYSISNDINKIAISKINKEKIGIFKYLLDRIEDDIKDYGYSGFRVTLSKKYDMMCWWDQNGNLSKYPNQNSSKLNRTEYNIFLEYLNNKYILELEDTERLGGEESYIYDIRPKNSKYVNESFFDDIEDDLEIEDNTIDDLTTKSYIKQNTPTKYVNETEYKSDITNDEIERYIRYVKLVNFILDHNAYLQKYEFSRCRFKIIVSDEEDHIIIDTTDTKKFNSGIYDLIIKGDEIIYATLPSNYIYAGDNYIRMELLLLIKLYYNLNFTIKEIHVNTINKIKELDLNFSNLDTDLQYTPSNEDIIKFFNTFELPEITVDNSINITKCELSFNSYYDREIRSTPNENYNISKESIYAICNNIKNTYQSRIYMYWGEKFFIDFLSWSIENKNMEFTLRSKQEKDDVKSYIFGFCKEWLETNNYKYGSIGYNIEYTSKILSDRQFGKYVEGKILLTFKDDISGKYLYIDFIFKLYLSGKLILTNTRIS